VKNRELLRLEGITKSFVSFEVLKGLDLSVGHTTYQLPLSCDARME